MFRKKKRIPCFDDPLIERVRVRSQEERKTNARKNIAWVCAFVGSGLFVGVGMALVVLISAVLTSIAEEFMSHWRRINISRALPKEQD